VCYRRGPDECLFRLAITLERDARFSNWTVDERLMEVPAREIVARSRRATDEIRQGEVPAFKEWALVCASIERGETDLQEGRNC
jgi:hypothetical protein